MNFRVVVLMVASAGGGGLRSDLAAFAEPDQTAVCGRRTNLLFHAGRPDLVRRAKREPIVLGRPDGLSLRGHRLLSRNFIYVGTQAVQRIERLGRLLGSGSAGHGWSYKLGIASDQPDLEPGKATTEQISIWLRDDSSPGPDDS